MLIGGHRRSGSSWASLAGGTLGNLASIRLRRAWLLLVGGRRSGSAPRPCSTPASPIVEALRLPLLATAFALLLVALWVNRRYPGLSLAFVGILFERHRSSSSTAATCRSGSRACVAAGFPPAEIATRRSTRSCRRRSTRRSCSTSGPLADVIPIPLPFIQNVASVGDAFLAAGLAFFLFAGVVRIPQELTRRAARGDPPAPGRARPARPAAAGRRPAAASWRPASRRRIADSAALDRPLVLGGAGQRLASPSPAVRRRCARPAESDELAAAAAPAAAGVAADPGSARPSSGSASTRTSGSRSTARSRRCGPAS